jgi:hypothetical protein
MVRVMGSKQAFALHMKKRSYKITCSLKEGYAPDGRLFDIADAAQIIKQWMEKRLHTQQPIVSGLLQQGTLFFPSVDDSQPSVVTISPTAIFTGELSSPEDMERTEEEVRATLESLGYELKEHFGQEEVFIIYLDKNWSV